MLERQREDIAKAKAEGNTGDAHRRHEQRPQRFDACMANGLDQPRSRSDWGLVERAFIGFGICQCNGAHLRPPG
jgi:hypothetical protein